MNELFLKLLNMSISASWLVLAVVALRFALKKAPKSVRCVLWALVGIRLVCPFSFESVLSLIPNRETVPPEIVYARQPAIDSGVAMIDRAVNPVITSSFAPSGELTSANPIQIWLFLAEIVWAVGMAAMAAYALVSYLRLHRKVSASVNLRENIWICDYIDTPFILGMIKPRIYLPSAMKPESVVHVLAHERAHLKRRDHWWKPLGFLLLMVHWFNPVMWVAYILLCRDIELACDERVIRELNPEKKKAYSEALLSCSVPRSVIAAGPLAFGEVGVKERVRAVLNYKRPAFWLTIAAVIVCVAAAVCFLTDPVAETELTDPLPTETQAAGHDAETFESVDAGVDYTFSTRDEIYVTVEATKDGKTVSKEFEMGGMIDRTGTMDIKAIGKVALVSYSGGEACVVHVYQLVNDEITLLGTIDCGADMVKEATYTVDTKNETTAVIEAKRNSETITNEFEMSAAIADTSVMDILDYGKVVLVAETGGEYYAIQVYRLSQDYTTGNTKEIPNVGFIQYPF